MNKFLLKKPTKTTKYLSLLIIFLIVFCLGFFGYYFYYKDENENDFSISGAMEKANKPGVITTSLISYFLIIYLHSLRKNSLILNYGSFLITVIISVLISILYVTQDYDLEAHVALAAIAFLSILIYNILVVYTIYKTYKNYKFYLIILSSNVLIASSLILFLSIGAFMDGLEVDSIYFTLFALGELLLVALLLVSFFLLGFYKISYKQQKI